MVRISLRRCFRLFEPLGVECNTFSQMEEEKTACMAVFNRRKLHLSNELIAGKTAKNA
jgi:hypothetical protein